MYNILPHSDSLVHKEGPGASSPSSQPGFTTGSPAVWDYHSDGLASLSGTLFPKQTAAADSCLVAHLLESSECKNSVIMLLIFLS